MARFNTHGQRPLKPILTATSPLSTTSTTAPDTKTFEGAPGWDKNPRTDLYTRLTSSFHGEGSYYESAQSRDETARQLVRKLAVDDFAWLCQFAQWLRGPGNMRTAAIALAADAVKARLDEEKRLAMIPGPSAVTLPDSEYSNRWIIDVVCQRADEPGEMIAYWLAAYGKGIPKPVKRGVADAAARLYTTRNFLKYDSDKNAVRFADVLDICHPSPAPDKAAWQGDLFQYAIDKRHGHDGEIPASLPMLLAREQLTSTPVDQRRQVMRDHGELLQRAGMTWESLAGWLQGPMDKEAWESVIPSMGYMALLRNLRNFDEAGVSDAVANQIILMLKDPAEVAKSRQLPFRFYSAYKATSSDRWSYALSQALDLCLPNIPVFTGRTMVLVDTSGSMTWYDNKTSGQGRNGASLKCVAAAALFGSALALKNPDATDLVVFDTSSHVVQVPKGGSVLRLTEHIERNANGGGTYTAQAIERHYAGHDRVIILTDEQTHMGQGRDVAASVPNDVPVYAFCLVGYSASAMPTGSAARHNLGGLTDATFALIPRLEAGASGAWPWELEAS